MESKLKFDAELKSIPTESINKLSRNMVSMYKKNSDTAANELNSEKEWGAYPLMIETEISKKSKQVLSY